MKVHSKIIISKKVSLADEVNINVRTSEPAASERDTIKLVANTGSETGFEAGIVLPVVKTTFLLIFNIFEWP